MLVGTTHEQDAGVGHPVEAERPERHRVRLGDLGIERLVVPPLPLHHRVGVHVVDVERLGLVLHPALAYPVSHRVRRSP